MQNREIAAIFNKLADLLEIKGEDPFKIRACRKAVKTLEALGKPVTAMITEGKELSTLPGIGKDLAEKIKEILHSGKLQTLENLKKEFPESLCNLLSIEGLDPKHIKILYETLQISDPDMLKEAALHRKISKLPGFDSQMEEKILKGIRLLKHEGVRFLYADAEPIIEELITYMKKAPGILTVEAAGSFRRKKETVGDIDILCTAKKPPEVIDFFTKFTKVLEVISAGTTQSTVVLRNNMQINLRIVDKESYGAALYYFTGSKTHIIAMRKIANDLGVTINEYGVFKNERKIAGRTEKDIYDSVRLPVITPELRENRGEAEAAAENKLPNLITMEDIRGDLHMHTTYSDGTDTLETMVKAAVAKNYAYIAITDHSATLAIVTGMDAQKILMQFADIEKLKAKYAPFYIFKGMEVDILEDGSIGMEDTVLQQLDIALGAIHSKFTLTKKEQTKRLIKAIQNPYIKGIAHPTGRVIGKRTPLNIDFNEICKAIKDEGKFLEINSQPKRLDLNDIFIKAAKEIGVKFSITTDAHASGHLAYMCYGINQARRGWLEKEDVVNTKSLEALVKFLK